MFRKIYLATTQDEYELPIAIADTPKELAEILETNSHDVLMRITHNKSGYCKSYCYRIEYTEKEWNDD